MVDLVVLDRLLRATSKKGRPLFLRKQCTPDKILATPMAGCETQQILLSLTTYSWSQKTLNDHYGPQTGVKNCRYIP